MNASNNDKKPFSSVEGTEWGTDSSDAAHVVTARDYTIMELRRNAKAHSRKMFMVGLLTGIATGLVVAFVMGIIIR